MITIGEDARRPIVRVKATWAAAWTTLPEGSYELPQFIEGCSSSFGSATMTTWLTATVNREQDAPAHPTIVRDGMVQIGAVNKSLKTTDPDYIRWQWIAMVESSSFVHEGTETTGTETAFIVRFTHKLVGLGAMLARAIARRGRCLTGDGTAIIDLPMLPDFNTSIDGGIRGNRSAAQVGGRWAHDLRRTGTGQPWTAQQVFESLLADHLNATYFPNWPTFQLSGQTGMLAYNDAWRLSGQPLDEILTKMAGPGRGGNWTIEPDPSGTGVVNIRLTSGLKTAIDLTAVGGPVLPASDRQVVSIDTGDSHFRYVNDLSDRKRRWTLHGTVRTQVTLRWRVTGATPDFGLIRGWDPTADANAGSDFELHENVYHYWMLDPAWTGMSAVGDDVDANIGGCAKSLKQTGGYYDGERLRSAGTFVATQAQLDPLWVIPPVAGASAAAPQKLSTWATTPTTPLPADVPVERVRVWIEISGVFTDITDTYDIRVVKDPYPGIIVGKTSEEAAALRAAIGDSGVLWVTLSIIEPLPLLIERDPGGTAGNDTLVKTQFVLHQVAKNCVLGIKDGTTDYIQTSGGRIIRDDRPQMKALLSSMGPYLDRAGGAIITDGLNLHAADNPLRPGALVGVVEDGRGYANGTTILSIITERRRTFTREGYGTELRLLPLTLDIRSFV